MTTTMMPTPIAEMREVGHRSEALPNHRLDADPLRRASPAYAVR